MKFITPAGRAAPDGTHSLIRDPALAPEGLRKIAWAKRYMPALREIEKEFIERKPFSGVRITTSVHLEAKTACLALTLKAGGAEVYATGCNPLSTQDDVAAGLASAGVNVFAFHGCDEAEYEHQLVSALACRPHLVLDDGGDLADLLHGKCAPYADCLLGATEETTTGVLRLRARQAAGKL
ncbi:MAG: adenosylhomocysteinase, partial [Oscillospiraceae bacterium]|nr:adenosylhomocysteinase [Oscillospiraceae bacterium]